nr:SWF/SNF helicase family protein [Bacteroidota bacterium]
YDNYELPAKLEYLIKFVKELNINGLKVLIWSNFIDTIKLISNIINKEDIKAEKIIGSVPSEKENLDNNVLTREKIISNFLDGDIDVLIANPAACAESISLHKNCFHAIYYDLSYNLAQYLQSIDRIHRVGGSEEKTANYYFLQYTNTVEYKIKKNLDKKKKRMYDIIEKDFSIYDLYMSEEDDIDEIREIKEIVE